MSALLTEGQARLAPLCRAVEALHEGDVVDVDALLWAWRSLRPRCHPKAATDEVDVAAVVDVLRRRPAALGQPLRLHDDDPRGAPRRQLLARCLADACTLALERSKLGHGLVPAPAALKAAFASPDDARATLQALADSAPVTIGDVSANVDGSPLSVPAGVVHLVVGAGARRLLDLLSPALRKLRVDLALLGRAGGAVDDDDVYRGLLRLNAREPGCVIERRAHPGEPRDEGGVFVVEPARLQEEQLDRRARALLAPLKKGNVVVVGVVDPVLLPWALALRPASVQVLAAATTALSVRALLDGARGGVLPVRSDDDDGATSISTSISVPWLGLLPADVDGCDDAWFACTQVWRARVDDDDVPAPRLLLASERESSAVALEALARLVPARR